MRAGKASVSPVDLPDFIAPQLCQTLERPPVGKGWIHEIKFDGYRIQMRVLDGEATLKTRKGLDWTAKYREIGEAASALPDSIIDGEICALDENGAPDFAALQAALSEGKAGDLVYFAFDLLYDGGEDLRSLSVVDRKARLQSLLAEAGNNPRIRFVEHFETGGDAVLDLPANCRWKASSQSRWTRRINPAEPKPGPNPNVGPATRSCWGLMPRRMASSDPCWSASTTATTSSMSAALVPDTARRKWKRSLRS
ncbi:hypothetical protein AJ87_39570 [Rhizobium yanglingense]|nr:hypothetical protein AJ87_39570 [Rhizobium yanglingense]